MIQKIINFRMFSDADDKMNLSINAINGEILLVSQFTLAADTNAGKRPSFSSAMEPKRAKEMYDLFAEKLKKEVNRVETGKFGADSKVSLVNDGPVTFMLSC
jgi:D-tyrosyl-tRNA(Tyr) deacylase